MVPHTRRRSVAEAEEAMEHSSSDEEEESMEESEDLWEESDSESEGDMNNGPPPKKQLTSLPHHSSSEIAIHSNAIRNSAPELNPTSSKPTRESPRASKKPRSKPSTDVHPSSSKSPADSLALQKVTDSKNDADEAVEYENFKSDSKRQLFKRLWSEDDEIAILKGLIEHAETEGVDPASTDINSFYEFIRNSVHIDASKSQLKEKIRRMKKRKYQSYLNKNNNGGVKVFSKAHAQTCYDLSRKIWGTESKRSSGVSKRANLGSPNLNRNIIDMKVDQAGAADAATPSMAEPFYRQEVELSSEKEMMKHWSRLITGAKKIELDDKLKRIQVKEMEVYLQKLDCMREQAALVLETLKSSIK